MAAIFQFVNFFFCLSIFSSRARNKSNIRLYTATKSCSDCNSSTTTTTSIATATTIIAIISANVSDIGGNCGIIVNAVVKCCFKVSTNAKNIEHILFFDREFLFVVPFVRRCRHHQLMHSGSLFGEKRRCSNFKRFSTTILRKSIQLHHFVSSLDG